MKKIILGIGAVLSGILASICCLGPVVLALFGLGLTGLAQLHKYRPVFIALSLAFLGLAFYFVYRKREIKCADGTCHIESSSKTTKIILWIITAIVLGANSFLWWYPALHTKLNAANTTKSFIERPAETASSNRPPPARKQSPGNYEIGGICCE